MITRKSVYGSGLGPLEKKKKIKNGHVSFFFFSRILEKKSQNSEKKSQNSVTVTWLLALTINILQIKHLCKF